jgi:hypothetical protein
MGPNPEDGATSVSAKLDAGRERPPWPCGCPNEHANVATRSWCSACSEWCYPDGLCVRGELAKLRAEHAEMAALLARMVKRGWVHEADFIQAAQLVARIQGEAR